MYCWRLSLDDDTMTSVCASSKIWCGSTHVASSMVMCASRSGCFLLPTSPEASTSVPRPSPSIPSTSHLLHRLPLRRLAHSLDVAESANQQTRVGNCRHGATTAIKMCTHWGWWCIINTPPNYFCSPPERTMDMPSRNMSKEHGGDGKLYLKIAFARL